MTTTTIPILDQGKLEAFGGQAVVVREAGFSQIRNATETPFNIILEAKP